METEPRLFSLFPHFMGDGGDCFGENEQIFVYFSRKPRGVGGGAGRKWYCVYGSDSLCFSCLVLSNNAECTSHMWSRKPVGS